MSGHPPRMIQTTSESRECELLDWPTVVEKSCTVGLAKVLAQYAAMKSFDSAVPRLVLELPNQLQALVEHGGEVGLKSALTSYFGAGLQLEIVYGHGQGSIAYERQRAALDSCARMLQTLVDSGVIDEMEAAFGARPILTSVRYAR